MMVLKSNPKAAGFWFGISLYLNSALLLLATPVFTRLMTAEEYGEVTLYASLNLIVGGIATLSLYAGVFDRALVDFGDRIYEHVAAMMGLIVVCTLLTAGVFGAGWALFGNFTGVRSSLLVFMFLNLIANSAYLFWRSMERFEYRYKLVSVVSIGASVLGVGAALWLMMLPSLAAYKVEVRVLAAALPLFLCGLVVSGFVAKRGGSWYRSDQWWDALKVSLPLIPHYLSQSFLQQFDRFAIAAMASKADVGVYGLACAVASGLTLFWTAINSAWTPWLYRALHAGNVESIRRLATGLIGLVAIAAIIGTLIAPEIIQWIAPASYGMATKMLPYLLLASLFQFAQSIYLAVQFYDKKSGQITAVSLIAAVVNVVLNLGALSAFGAVAAAWAATVGQVLQLVLHRRLSRTGGRHDLMSTAQLAAVCGSAVVLTILIAEGLGADNVVLRWLLVLPLVAVASRLAWFLHKSKV